MKFILTSCFIATIFFCQAQKTRPLLHLIIGKTYNLTATGSTSTVQGINGRENKVDLSVNFQLAFKAEAFHDTVYELSGAYRSIEVRIGMPDTAIKMSGSVAEKRDTGSLIITKLIGKPFRLVIAAGGHIKSVNGLDELITGAVKSIALNDSLKRLQASAQIAQLLGPNAIRNLLEQGLAIFPDKPVSTSDQWTTINKSVTPYPVQLNTVYRLFNESATGYEVYGDGTMSSDTTAKAEYINGVKMKYMLTGTTLADIRIDKESGWITEAQIRQWVSGEIRISDDQKSSADMAIPIMFNTEITITDQ